MYIKGLLLETELISWASLCFCFINKIYCTCHVEMLGENAGYLLWINKYMTITEESVHHLPLSAV